MIIDDKVVKPKNRAPGTKLISFSVDEKVLEDFSFLYSSNVRTRFLRNCLSYAVKRRDILEFFLFDDVDDFSCNRTKLLYNKQI